MSRFCLWILLSTSLWERALISLEVLEQLSWQPSWQLRGRPRVGSSQTIAVPDKISILSEPRAQRILKVLIAGFTFRSNSTLGILQELEQSDAIPVNPSAAPVGSVLVCPTTWSPTGPVSLGSATIVGSDGNVYGPDIRKGCAWTSFGKLETWIELHANKNQLFGFLLRAHPGRT